RRLATAGDILATTLARRQMATSTQNRAFVAV
ncbi:hypothetical protein A2U01_0086489, partial [Trifolium medium]|nr:hypothetical protein [Trifolium medium]